MSFARPEYLWLLTALVPLAFSVALGRIRRAQEWSALVQGGRLLGDGGLSWLAAIGCLIVALAQPRWGLASAPPIPPGHDVVLVLDVSRSMGAEDAVPNRLGIAVEAASSLVKVLRRTDGNRAAVVAFAGRGVIRCPLTEHLGAVDDTLHELKPGEVRPGGTDLAAALDTALDAFDDQEHAEGRAIVLFTDGEDLAGSLSLELDRLRASHVVVHTVAVGDAAQGHEVPSGRGGEPLRYKGKVVLSKRDDRSLDAIAKATGGALVGLGLATADLGALYLSRIAPIARRKAESARIPERVERYGVFVLLAVSLGLGGGWHGRRRWFWGRAWLVLAAIVAIPGAGPPPRSPTDAVARGRDAFLSKQYDAALAAFELAIRLDPGAPVPRYNAAATLYQLERFDESMARYQEARQRAGARLRTKIDFAIGNTALALGDVPVAIRAYDDCLASNAVGADLDAVRADAAINRRFAEEQPKNPSSPPPGDDKSANPDREGNRPPPESDENPGDGQPKSKNDGASGSPTADPRKGGPGQDREGARSSAEDRLNAALNHVRQAKLRQLAEQTPPTENSDGKDW